MTPTAADVRAFVIEHLSGALRERGVEPSQVGDDFDLLRAGVIDSFGVLELITQVGEHFGIDVDFEELDPEGLTVLGTFSAYVARSAAQAA